jgi:hypothetical protein
MPPLAECDNDNYDDGKEDDGKGETPEERAKILHCIFRDFYCPPPLFGWVLTALRQGERLVRGGCHGRVQ